MLISKVVRVNYLVVSFAIGMFFVWMQSKERKKVYVFPSPDTVENVQYTDSSGMCFTYKQEHVPCPADKKKIHIPTPQLPFL